MCLVQLTNVALFKTFPLGIIIPYQALAWGKIIFLTTLNKTDYSKWFDVIHYRKSIMVNWWQKYIQYIIYIYIQYCSTALPILFSFHIYKWLPICRYANLYIMYSLSFLFFSRAVQSSVVVDRLWMPRHLGKAGNCNKLVNASSIRHGKTCWKKSQISHSEKMCKLC